MQQAQIGSHEEGEEAGPIVGAGGIHDPWLASGPGE